MAEANQNSDVEGSASELSIDAAVVSISAIADASARLDGVRRLTVRRKAIVTPAVRDLLRQRQIELVYRADGEAARNSGKSKNAVTRLVVAAADTNDSHTDGLIKLLARMPIAVERLASAGLAESIDELVRQIAALATVGLLLTAEPAVAVCLANRLSGVRAMAAGDTATLGALSAAAKAIGANLLIIDPAGRSPFAIRPWIKRFCQGRAASVS